MIQSSNTHDLCIYSNYLI